MESMKTKMIDGSASAATNDTTVETLSPPERYVSLVGNTI